MKDHEHKEPSSIGKGTSYFNILECGRNILDQLGVTYQRAFMESPVQEGYYTSPARERYYEQLTKILINSNVESDGTINNDKLNKAITDLKAEEEAGHKRNINNMTQVDNYKSPWKDKDATTVNDSAYHNLDEYEDEISDSDKNVEARKQPITDTHVSNTSVGIISVKPAAVGVGIIGRGGRGITQGMIIGGTSIVKDVFIDVLTNSSKMIFIDPLKSQTLVVALQN